MKGHNPSGSAIGTLTVPPATLKSDTVLQLVIQAASQHQLIVKTPSKGGVLHLELLNGVKLTHRNSILRCLCGMGLHNALDCAPHFLLGGHAAPSMAAPHHAMALASLSSWMSVADQVRTSNYAAAVDKSLMEDVNNHLETRAFLIDSPSMTLADIDLAVAIVSKTTDMDAVITAYPHLHRWLSTIQEGMKQLYGLPLSSKTPVPHAAPSEGPQLFFFGNESGVEIPKVATPASTEEPKGGGDKKGKNQQQQQKQQQSKKDGKASNKPAKDASAPAKQPTTAASDSFDVSALDIRVGQIVKVWHHPEAEKLFCEEIDIGEEQPRQIASGLRPFYQTSELENRRVVVLCNLKKRNLVGFPSHGMVLCASNDDHTDVECMEPPADAKIGERVTFDKYTGDPEPENKIAKKKIFEVVAPDLKTNSDGTCVWKDSVSQTSAGPIKASKGMPNAQVA
ncbi:methionyl-tRNA synthetase [Nitzschia inconspicua]|uniref:Methionyl-tRNA synthetase n=1 Tax=Nitzschia inconspicua TaxID=303405 RepID=A0A9K3PET6_9STRA|nr:methionyl-tRNA synthetase [Nitzschia inconspicua]